MANLERRPAVVSKKITTEAKETDWATLEMQNGWIQAPKEQWDTELEQVLWKSNGEARQVVSYQLSSSTNTLQLTRPVQTRFVGVRTREGTIELQAFEPQTQGHWQDIPNIGKTPAQLTKIPEHTNEAFSRPQARNARKLGGSQTVWPQQGGATCKIIKKVS